MVSVRRGWRSGLPSGWLFKPSAPEPGEIVLTQRRVFILPSKAGLGLAVLLVAMFIGSINYNLSLGFGLTFLIAACAVIDMHLTFRNLATLHLTAGQALPIFAGENAHFDLQVSEHRGYDRFAIWIGFVGSSPALPLQAIDVAATATTAVKLGLPSVARGWFAAPRIRLSTCFPLGLLRAWSIWYPDTQVLVYPRPETDAPPLPIADRLQTDGYGLTGTDDFAGIRVYRPGDTPRQLAWRHIARTDVDAGAALISKHFESSSMSDLVLDFNHLPTSLAVELRLSRMTHWILEAESRGLPYGFKLGATRLDPGFGPEHRQVCLRALALYEGH